MKTHIYLSTKKINPKQLAPVYCRITQGKERSEIALGIFVHPKNFCAKRKLIKLKDPMADSFNKRIIQAHSKIYDIITFLEIKGIQKPFLVREIFRHKKKLEIIDLHKTLPSFTKWCENYITTKYTKKYNTQRIYIEALNHVKKLEISLNIHITRIDYKTAKLLYDYLDTKNRLSYLSKIKFLSRMYHDHFNEENTLQKFKVPSRDKYQKGALSQDELHLIMCHVPQSAISKIYLDIFLFQYFSAGSRVGDVLNMRWTDISENKLKRIEEKTGKERHLPINSTLNAILNKYKGNQSEFVFALNQPPITSSNKEWCKYKSRIVSSINSCLKTIKKNLQLPTNISTHTSRHTFATHTFETTRDVKATSILIGHSKLATTEMYLHTGEQLSIDLFAKVYEEKNRQYRMRQLS